MEKRVWITWENQRRSVELSRQLNCKLFILEYDGITKYFKSIFKTLRILENKKPDILFVQNPSMILAAIACVYHIITKVPLIIDRHTTFQLNKKFKPTPRNLIFKLLNFFTLKFANLTIVTNEFLAKLVKRSGGQPFVLQDKLPSFFNAAKKELLGRKRVMLISSFSEDEPIKEVLQAMEALKDKDIYLYITGNHRKLNELIIKNAPPNVIFTGFLSGQDFVNMLFSVDIIMVLTNADYCMLCGCYEAVSAEKPLITSDKKVLEDYFKGAMFVDNTANGISRAIREIMENLNLYTYNTQILKQNITADWQIKYNRLESLLSELLNFPRS